MNNTEPGRWALWLSFPLTVILAVACLGGLFLSSTYAQETRMQAALGIGNDAGNLAIIVPVLVIGAILALRGSAPARLVWMGTLAYLVYPGTASQRVMPGAPSAWGLLRAAPSCWLSLCGEVKRLCNRLKHANRRTISSILALFGELKCPNRS